MKLRLTTTLTVLRDVIADWPGLSNGRTVELEVSVTGDVERALDDEGLDVELVSVDDGRRGDLVEQVEDLTFMEQWQAEGQLRAQFMAHNALSNWEARERRKGLVLIKTDERTQ